MHWIRIIVRDYYSSGGWSCKIFYQNNFNCKFVHSTRIQRARETIPVRFLRGILTTISTTMLFCWFSFLLSFFFVTRDPTATFDAFTAPLGATFFYILENSECTAFLSWNSLRPMAYKMNAWRFSALSYGYSYAVAVSNPIFRSLSIHTETLRYVVQFVVREKWWEKILFVVG